MEETHLKRLLVLCSAHHPWLCLLALCSPLNDEMNILYASAAEHLTSSIISPPSSWHKRKQPVENDLAGPVKSPRNPASQGPHICLWCSLLQLPVLCDIANCIFTGSPLAPTTRPQHQSAASLSSNSCIFPTFGVLSLS